MEIRPTPLQNGDVIRIVSPASTPNRQVVERCSQIFQSWGLKVEVGRHVFAEHGFLAGTDAERAADLNDAFRDPTVRAIYAARGGKGSYRLVDSIDYRHLRDDPKFLVGFSDITALHFAIWNHCGLASLHGGLFAGRSRTIDVDTESSLRSALMSAQPIEVHARTKEPTFALTTSGPAKGRLLGGNLSIMATSAGWLLPDLRGAVVLMEATDMGPGLLDRMLQMMRKSGRLDGIAGIAVGQFENVRLRSPLSVIDLLREHLAPLSVPILGGLPIGHGDHPLTVQLGRMVELDADRRALMFPS